MSELNPNSFNQAYGVLKANADKLRNQQDLDIDALVPLVDESSKAFAICRDRIQAVKAALAEHLRIDE
jgi:exodeoxyribonuclease VII small subunit